MLAIVCSPVTPPQLMGCGESRAAYEISPLETELFRELRLSKQEVDKFLSAFNEIDLDGSGMIRMDELFGSCRIEESHCNKKIFGMFDSDNSGTLNFSEFGTLYHVSLFRSFLLVCAMWMFLTLSESDLALFLYNLFDADHSGALDVSEIKNIISVVHHKLLNGRTPIQRLLDELSKRDHRMTSDEFASWAKSNPSLLEPIFHLHLDLRKQLIGNGFWQTLESRRYGTGNQMSPQYVDLIQKRLDKIADDFEKRSQTSKTSKKSKKKVHPSSGTKGGSGVQKSSADKKQTTTEKNNPVVSSDKKQKTNEKNSLVTAEENNPLPRKKSNTEEIEADGKQRRKSNVGLEQPENVKVRRKSNAGASVEIPDNTKARRKSNAGQEVEVEKQRRKSNVALDDGSHGASELHGGDHKHHHHGHHHHEKDKSHGGSHHHHGHHHGSHSPNDHKNSRTSSL